MSMLAPVTPIAPSASKGKAAVWLSPEQVCEHVPGMTPEGLSELRKTGKGPAYYKPTPKKVVYSLTDVDAWIVASRVTTRDQS